MPVRNSKSDEKNMADIGAEQMEELSVSSIVSEEKIIRRAEMTDRVSGGSVAPEGKAVCKMGAEMIDSMVVRVLDLEENGRTRQLWEDVFCEDSAEFLDYYYTEKTKDNQIYVVEDEGQILSMLHLNPYEMTVEGTTFPSYYVVAVATDEKYRGRGYMRNLLNRSMVDLYRRKVPFIFLMPAAEAIYAPYGFRYIYSQRRSVRPVEACGGNEDNTSVGLTGSGNVGVSYAEMTDSGNVGVSYAKMTDSGNVGMSYGEMTGGRNVTVSCAGLSDCERMASYFQEHFAGKWQVRTVRDKAYYERMILEQKSQLGEILLLEECGRLVGIIPYGADNGLEIREPLLSEGYEEAYENVLYNLAKSLSASEIKEFGVDGESFSEEKPLIMARIICMGQFLTLLKARKEEELDCSFAVIDTLLTGNSRIWRISSPAGDEKVTVKETEDSEGVFAVEDLTEYLFGRITIEQLGEREGTHLTERLERELEKLCRLERVFLNEIV